MKKLKKKKAIACFSHWTRKSYAVFNSLGKQIKIGVLAVSCSLVALPCVTVVAQQTTTNQLVSSDSTDIGEPIPLEGIVVEGQISLFKLDEARIVKIISKKEIAELPVNGFQSLLKTLAGIDVRQRGTNGVQADVSVRGGTFDQAVILINGINFSDPQTGHHNLNLPIDLASIDRIEILEGPGNGNASANAFSGAINIVTGTLQENQLKLKLEGGQFGLLNATANGTFQKKIKNKETKNILTSYATSNYSRSDGYIDNTDFAIFNTFLQIRYNTQQWGNFNCQAGYQQKAFGANSFYSFAYPNQFESTRTLLSSLSWQKKLSKKLQLNSDVSHRRHHDHFELFRSNPPASYTAHNYHQTDVWASNLLATYFSQIGKTTLGASWRNEHIFSNKLGEKMPTPQDIPHEATTEKFTHEKGRNVFNASLEQTIYLQKSTFGLGITESYSNSFGSYTRLGGSFSYKLHPNLLLLASAQQSLRLPTFTDLYYQSPTHSGNPNLKPEQATTFELGIKNNQNALKTYATTFFRMGKNLIDWTKMNANDKWQAQNHATINTLGIETGLAYTPAGNAKRFLKSIKADYTFLSMTQKGNLYISSYVLDFLKHKFSLLAIHPIYKNLNCSWTLSVQDRQGSYKHTETSQLVAYPVVALVDAKLFWNTKKWTLYAEGSNVLNIKYFDFGNLYQPGIWLKAGVEVRF